MRRRTAWRRAGRHEGSRHMHDRRVRFPALSNLCQSLARRLGGPCRGEATLAGQFCRGRCVSSWRRRGVRRRGFPTLCRLHTTPTSDRSMFTILCLKLTSAPTREPGLAASCKAQRAASHRGRPAASGVPPGGTNNGPPGPQVAPPGPGARSRSDQPALSRRCAAVILQAFV